MKPILFLIMFGCLLSFDAQAETEIHKCIDADGNIAFMDSPCPEPKPAESKDEAEDAEPAEFAWDPKPVLYARSADEIEACKEGYRDQIDAIEAEILAGFSPEDGPAYKEQLLTLTSAMRDCERG